MGSSISTNLNSLNAQESFRQNNDFQAAVIRRLTSGYRISRAGDDPAGLAIANQYRTDVGELTQGIRNLNDGISRLQIIDGGIDNISKILDRLKVLASQSSADTFSGDRLTLNSEFQTLLGEMDRQAESIGLNSNGQYANVLSVWVGGSGGNRGTAVAIDLNNSAVDSQALGLGGASGTQAVAAMADISPSSLTHTVAQIVADTANTSAINGYTDFYFSGPGFSDDKAIRVSVNLQGVDTLKKLVGSINAAIQVAGAGTAPEAIAFQQAGITASSYYGFGLAFGSTDTPFQVKAGDVMANALMGNLNGTAGVPMASTVQGVVTAAPGAAFPTGVTVRINGGGLASPVDIVLSPTANTTALAIADLTAQIGANAQLSAAGISVSGAAGGALTFTHAQGEIFSAEASGDTENALGLGSFVAGSGGAVESTSIQGTAYDNTLSSGTAHLEFSFAGGASVAIPGIDLGGGDAVFPASRSGADLQKTLNDAFNANPALVAAGLVAAFAGNALTISSANNTSFRLNAGTSDATADIGFGVKGAAFTSSLTAAQAGSHTVDCSGTTAVAKLSFNGMVYGNDPQTITVSTTGLDGRPQTASITLRNDVVGQSGRSIDEAIAAINAQLQQGTSPLRQIVAVKENVGGEERIGFLSSLRSFQVIAGSSANSAGVNGGAPVTENSYAVGALLHVSVDTADSARLALTAVVDAVGTLGAAQAVVGKAQNQLSYAIDLSQSEVTNFSSAESRIRDADVAAEAANLTKAQILGQASISIMSQANTLSEAVLALLRG